MKPEVGNTVTILWRRGHGRESGAMEDHEITKIGRRWVTLKSGHYESRFEIEGAGSGPFDLDAGGYSSPGRIFMTREAAETWVERVETWDRLRDFLRGYEPPRTLTLEDLTHLERRMKEDADEA